MANRTATKKKTRKITVNVSESVCERIEEAASWRGLELAEFFLDAATREADAVIERERVIRLSPVDAKLIFSLMQNPPPPNEALKKALRTHKRLTRGG